MLSAIIIDDQQICTEMLVDLLESGFPDVKLLAVAHSGKEGLAVIQSMKPDLVILDVEMPGMNGFEMLREIDEPDFEIIFVTAHDRYSIEALRLSALDYLVKPVHREDLRAAINRAGKQHKHPVKMQ